MGVAVAIAGAAIGAASSIAGGLAGRRKAEAQSAMLSRNAEIARQNAGTTRQVAQANAGLMKDQAVRLNAKAMTQAAGQNLALDSGSVRDIIAGNFINSEVRVQSYLNDSWRKALGMESQAEIFDIQAAEAHREGNLSLVAGFLGAGGSAAKAYTAVGGGDAAKPGGGYDTGIQEDVRDADNGNWWD